MKTKTTFDRAAALAKLAAVLNPEAAAVQAVVEYLAALRAWRRKTAPAVGAVGAVGAVVQSHPTAAGAS